LVNDVKAALNLAWSHGQGALPESFPSTVRKGLTLPEGDPDEEQAREDQVLTDGEIRRVLAAAQAADNEREWEGDLLRLVVVLAATGLRFSQVARIRVRDLQIEPPRLFVPISRKGKGRQGRKTHTPVPIGQDVLKLLQPQTSRPGSEYLLERWRHQQTVGRIEWIRSVRGPWQSGSEFSRDWKLIRDRVGLPSLVPYCFRHSSIVRSIGAGLPLKLVADRHDTSTTMIEAHYARWISTDLDALSARAVVSLL